MNFSRVSAVIVRQLYLLSGSPQRVLPMVAWVAVDMVLWGYLSQYLDEGRVHPELHFVGSLLGAVLLWDFMTRVMQGVTMAFFEDVWSRNFLNFFATPLKTSEYLAGLVITAIGTSLIGLVVMLALATSVFHLSFLAYGAALIPFLMVLFLTGIALGIAAAALVLRLGPASEWLVWPIPTLVAPFAGVFYPVTVLPGWMQAVSKILPPSFVFEAIRGMVNEHKPADWTMLAVGAALAALYLVLACLLFGAVYRHAIRTGLIARYSAETVS